MNQLITQLLSNKLKYLIAGLFIALSGNLYAQQTNVTGKVSDTKGEALIGVSVSEKNAKNATVTDIDGNFRINTSSPNAVLVFKYIGFATQEIKLNGRNSLNIALESENTALGEVVVIGYGTVKKSDLTGSVTSIKAEDLTAGANINLQQSLQGRAPGVQVTQRSGEPGSGMTVQIRGISSLSGNNSPLYVIDGMPVNDAAAVGNAAVPGTPNNTNIRNPLNSLNPNDIASIEILKDASATAIYGSRGANGVIIVTTKKGATGKLNVNYSMNYGVQKVTGAQTYLTGSQYRDVTNSMIDAGLVANRVPDDIYDTDWQSLLFKDGSIKSHDISLSGGTESTKFYSSLGVFDQDGVMENSATKRYVGRVNVENKIASKYAVGINLNASYSKDNTNSIGLGINDNASALYMAQNYDPTIPALTADGDFNRSPEMAPMDHPLAVSRGQYGITDTYRTFGNIYGEYFIVPALSVKARVGADFNNGQRNFWVDPTTLAAQGVNGIALIANGNRGYYLGEGTVNFNKTTGKHNLNGVGGVSYERFTSNTFSGNSRGFLLPGLTYNGIGDGDPLLNQISGGRQEWIILSYLGRLNYSLSDKYLFTFSFRADASSRFAANKRWGYFPSAALGWKIHEESFMQNVNLIDELKLRVSYGAIGNQPGDNYLYFSTIRSGRDAVFNGQRTTSLNPTRSPNPDLQWESANQFDLGADFAILQSKLSGSVEYYQRKTSNLLYDVPLPISAGFANRTENVGSMKNSGVELALNGRIISNKNIKWNANFNITTLKNEILSLGTSSETIGGGAGDLNNIGIARPGESIGSYYGYVVEGVWQTNDDFTSLTAPPKPGELKYKDVNQDKVINASDRVILGKALPDFFYGFNTDVTYKRLNLAVFIEGSKGASMINNSLVDSYFPFNSRRNKLAEPYLNRWTPTNPTNDYPSFIPGNQSINKVNSKTVEDASYLRLQAVRLGYDLPLKTLRLGRYVRNASIFLNAQNLFTISDYSGVDPALNSISNVLRVDYASYPLSTTITGGINFQF